ncbi:MAG: hypothetical protein GWO04_04900, partial [Actinobacteria bacterium]|nr:hypothetical protein [Actinomycetota bacterium]
MAADLSLYTFRLSSSLPPEGAPDTEPSRREVAEIIGTDRIRFSADHGFETGDRVLYDNAGGNDIGGLSNGFYYAIVV